MVRTRWSKPPKILGASREKTIVLTGALKPALFKTTDAIFNIGCAVIAVQTLTPGIYIVMNGCVFTHDHVRKECSGRHLRENIIRRNTMSQYWSRIVRELKPYIPGEQPKDDVFIKLNTNENPVSTVAQS